MFIGRASCKQYTAHIYLVATGVNVNAVTVRAGIILMWLQQTQHKSTEKRSELYPQCSKIFVLLPINRYKGNWIHTKITLPEPR